MNETAGKPGASKVAEVRMRRISLVLLAALLVACATIAFAQKKGADQTRSVQGVVTSPSEEAAVGVVVQLKNTKTLEIRSFITKENGSYYFHNLSPDIDYELQAKSQDAASPTKTLSAFDSRKQATINLKLNKK